MNARSSRKTFNSLSAAAMTAFAALVLAAAPARGGSKPQGALDECYGKPLAVHVTGWTFDPDVSSQSTAVQVYLYTDSNCTTLYDNPTLTANVPRHDVNQVKGIAGDHGFDADISVADAGDYWVKVFAIDATGDGNLQVGTTRSVTVAPRLPGSGTPADPYRISSAADWNIFASNISAGFDSNSCYRLGADIGSVTVPVGTAEHPFAGTFDGGSNTLTVALSGSDRAIAPFFRISGATIRNLKVAGTVSGAIHCSGLVGEVVGGPNLIENCEVAAAISCSESHFGGFIGHSVTYAVTLRGCVFSGSLSGGTYVATFNGWSDGGATTTLIDCLDASESDQPIGRGHDAACVSNTYYFATKNFNNEERLWSEGKRGKRAYAVTEGEGVTIDFGAPATTYGTTGITAYPTGLAYRGSGTLAASSIGTFYAAEGEVVSLDLAATPLFGMILDAYAASAGTLSQSGNAWTLAMPAQAVVVNATWQSATTLYPIGDVASWNAFANAVNGGMDTAGKYFILTDDIGPVTNTVGTQSHPFCGTFDGGGYALIANLSRTDDYVAPFSVIDGAVISNLVVRGTVQGGTYCSGLVGFAAGTNRVEDCCVFVSVVADGSNSGGIVGHGGTSATTIAGCLFKGGFSGALNVGTLWGWSDAGAAPVLIDCLDASYCSHPIGRGNAVSLRVENVYYLYSKSTTGTGPWPQDKNGKYAYSVTESRVTLDFGVPTAIYATSEISAYATGIWAYGVFYAGEGVSIDIAIAGESSSAIEGIGLWASAGSLVKSGGGWTLTMPDGDVTLSPLREIEDGAVLSGDFSDGLPFGIAAGATVTLSNAVIEASDAPGIISLGDAVIVLEGLNTVIGGYDSGCPGIQAGPTNTTLEISGGGSLTVEGGVCAAGIGSSYYGRECGDIVISGGTVTATGGFGAAGIGSGSDSKCGNIEISGGIIAATGGHGAVGIGSGDDDGECGDIVISGGTVTATGGRDAGGIGSGNGSECGDITITDGVTLLTSVNSGMGSNIGAGSLGSCGTVTVGGREMGEIAVSPYVYRPSSVPFAVSFNANGGSGSMTGQSFSSGIPQNLSSNGFTRAGFLFNGWNTRADGSGVYYYDGQPATFGYDTTLYAQWCGADVTLTPETGFVAMVDGQVLSGTGGTSTHVVVVPGATVTLSNVTINGPGVSEWAGITCLGNAVIVLEGSNTVNGSCDAHGGCGHPGIQPGPADTTLAIRGPGSLTAESVADSSGIGGCWGIPCGNIVIQGGTITASGAGSAAGIGSGEMSSCGNIVIQGGTITAINDDGAAGIGNGVDGECGDIMILGGSIVATGGYEAPGIGSGMDGECGDIMILGGSIVATGGYEAPGIGSGQMGSCGDITIGADVLFVTATCGDGGLNPIGAGVDGTCGTVTIAPDLTDETEDQTRRLSHPVTDTVTLTGESGEIRLTNGQTLVGEGNGNTHIVIAAGASVTFRDVTVDPDGRDARWAGVTCEGDAIITLVGTNSVTSSSGSTGCYSGIAVTQGHTLVIRGDGRLTASSKAQAGGIGNSGACGTIRIEGGDILAIGGRLGAGIGCYVGYGSCDAIVITGGRVRAVGGSEGAGIGAGSGGTGGGVRAVTGSYGAETNTRSGGTRGSVTITGGIVEAIGGNWGAGIGTGYNESCGDITISGGVVYAQGGSEGAGIGSAMGLRANMQSVCGNIVITGGVVTAIGGYGSAGIGSGNYYCSCGDIVIGADVTSVTATHGQNADNAIGAGIGGTCGTVTVAEELLDVTEGDTRTITHSPASVTYAAWAASNGITGAWDAADASGIHNVFRYLFDVPTGAFTNPPLLSITFDASGNPVIHTPPLNPSATDFDISILATSDLNVWGAAVPAAVAQQRDPPGEDATTYPLDPSGSTTIPATSPARFFRLRVTERSAT